MWGLALIERAVRCKYFSVEQSITLLHARKKFDNAFLCWLMKSRKKYKKMQVLIAVQYGHLIDECSPLAVRLKLC